MKSRRQWAALPAGELHPEDRCSFCGHHAQYPELKRCIVLSTHSVGMRCTDVVTCLRRKNNLA